MKEYIVDIPVRIYKEDITSLKINASNIEEARKIALNKLEDYNTIIDILNVAESKKDDYSIEIDEKKAKHLWDEQDGKIIYDIYD